MDKQTFQVSAQLMGAIPKVDGSMSVRFITQELPYQEKLLLMEYLGSAGWLLFKENSFKEEEVPKEDAPTDDDKTPAQRLRAVLYRLWEQTAFDKGIEFETFYRKKMSFIIDQFKSKLEQ